MTSAAVKKNHIRMIVQGERSRNTTKTQNSETETKFYYYGARYLDPRTSRWMSADPAIYQGDYIPFAPINDDAKKHNQNLPGMGGIFNTVNLHAYHYAGNNPIRIVDPNGRSDDEIDIAVGIEITVIRYESSYQTLRGQNKSERGKDRMLVTRRTRTDSGYIRYERYFLNVQSVDCGIYSNLEEDNTLADGSFYSRFNDVDSMYSPNVLTPTYAKLRDGRWLDGNGVAQQGDTTIPSNTAAHRFHDDNSGSWYSEGCIIGGNATSPNTVSLVEQLRTWGVQDGQRIFTRVVTQSTRP